MELQKKGVNIMLPITGYIVQARMYYKISDTIFFASSAFLQL